MARRGEKREEGRGEGEGEYIVGVGRNAESFPVRIPAFSLFSHLFLLLLFFFFCFLILSSALFLLDFSLPGLTAFGIYVVCGLVAEEMQLFVCIRVLF